MVNGEIWTQTAAVVVLLGKYILHNTGHSYNFKGFESSVYPKSFDLTINLDHTLKNRSNQNHMLYVSLLTHTLTAPS